MHLKTLACKLDQRSAQLKQEALGRIQVALAGAPPNCFYRLMQTTFGYRSGSTVGSGDLSEGEEEPPTKRPVSSTSATADKRTAKQMSSAVSPEATNATGFKPGTNSKRWSRTGLAEEYHPRGVQGEDKYSCPFPGCDYSPTQKFDTVATHIRRHLNIAIECHHCGRKFWSMTGWTKHCGLSHKGLDPVPADAEDPGTFTPLESAEATDITDEERQAVEEAANLPQQHYDVDREFREEIVTDDQA